MSNPPNKPERPLWVQIGLWGLPTRLSAWFFFWLSIAIAIGSALYAYQIDNPLFYVGTLALGSALWYFACIRWVDRHDAWK